jgi:hypothetical protein
MKEWIDTIRNGTENQLYIEKGFEEAITCHMATESYRQKRVVEWNQLKGR